MARVPSKHDRDQPPDFEGFLNNLQDWELSLKDKDKKLKAQSGNEKSKFGIVGSDRRPMGKSTSVDYMPSTRQVDYLGKYDSVGHLSGDFITEESSIDASSEKELGNDYFKQKKFKEAIDCYSRSLALSPTAVAYANRAMAYLKIKRFQEAEDDCTEALSLDDRYTKAYMRRSTARKELGKLKDSMDDAEFALRLEPQNQEIKKQYAEAKSVLYDKEILKMASHAIRGSTQGVNKERNLENNILSVPKSSQLTGVAETQEDRVKRSHSASKKDLNASVQQLAARAASLATTEAAKNITPPTSAYQFEVSWRGFSGDRTLQARLLKATSPVALPQIFKNALSSPLLIDIIRCIATFYTEEVDLAVKYLENLSKVSRFDMIIMCLSSADKADLVRLWDEVFCNKETPPECFELLCKLRSQYCPKQ